MKGYKKKLLGVILLCIFIFLTFKLEGLKVNEVVGTYELKKDKEPIRYEEEREYVVKKALNDSNIDNKSDKTKDQQKTTTVEVLEESKDTSETTQEIETARKDYENNYDRKHKITDNQFNGSAVYESPEGWSYEGEWVNDVIEGKGKMRYPNRDYYIGEFKQGEKSGQGTYYFADGSVYDGEWSNDMWDGEGKFVSSTGFSYEGDFVQGIKEGKGTYVFTNGDTYEGEFINDRENGKGVWSSTQGVFYEGDFVDGKRSGSGKMTYPDSSFYEGQWQDNKKEGIGVEVYVDEKENKIGTYEGEFVNNKRNGLGSYTYSNGIVMEGEWRDDEFVGEK